MEVVDFKIDFLVVPAIPREARTGARVGWVEFLNFVRIVRIAVVLTLFDDIFATSRYIEEV